MDIDYEVYRIACEKAINIADPEKLFFLLDHASDHVQDLPLSLYGEMAGCAYADHRALSREIIRRCTNEQIAVAPSYLLELFTQGPDYQMLDTLVEKGISSRGSAARTLHMLTYEDRYSYVARDLLQERMWVEIDDYNAFHSCVKNNAVGICKMLLDGGVDFDKYQQWAEHRGSGHEETVQALADCWQAMRAEMEQPVSQEMGGQTLA